MFPRKITHPGRIELGDDVVIGPNSNLTICETYNGERFDPRIRIGSRVKATAMLQLHALTRIEIEDDVLLAANVFMCDAFHGYRNGEVPYMQQPLERIAPITIGRGSWIGQNVVILPGVSIGEQCIVGANSVVTDSVPPGSVSVGAPAKVIKRWDWESKCWVSVSGER